MIITLSRWRRLTVVGGHQQGVVPGTNHRVPMSDGCPTIPDQRGHHPTPLRLSETQRLEWPAGDGGIGRDSAANHHQLSVGELDQLTGAAKPDDAHELFCCGRRRIDDEIDSEAVRPLTELTVLDPGNGHLGAQLRGGVTGQDVGTIGVGDCDQQVGLCCPCFLQHVDARTVPVQDERIDRFLHLCGANLVILDDGDVEPSPR
jgi:hypothetical protein